jgi:(S)-ureidoglycine-glyoxylate aminotransferase
MRDPLAGLGVPRRLLMGSGPSNPEVRVLQAMAAQSLAADDPALQPLFADVSQLCGAIFQTAPGARSLAVGGASRAGLEAAIASLIQPGDRVLVGVYGHFGELLCTLARLHGAEVERVEAEWGQPVDPDALTARIRARPPRLVAIVHADTSTGVLQPLEPIGTACQETETLLLVDAVLSLGGSEVNAAACHIDAGVAGLQKCLGGPPGLGLVALSEVGQTRLNPRPHSVYLDLTRSTQDWARPRAAAEVSTPMLLAAREALRIVFDEGLPARWQRHQQASQALRAGIDAMGLQRFGNPAHQVPMITLVNVPDGIDEAGVRQQLLVQHGIEIMAAFGPLRGRVWRIGTLGTNACLPSVLAVLGGLEAVLVSRGFQLARGAAVDAASRPPL